MKRLIIISIFIFMTGLFAGMFFSTGLSDENNIYLSSILLSQFSTSSAGFFRVFFSSLLSNMGIAALMLASANLKILCPIPFVLLWYKSFTIGFCSSLIQLSTAENTFFLALVKILPQNLLLIPAFVLMAATAFHCSHDEIFKTKRPSRETKGLKNIILICLVAVILGCIIESALSLVAL